MNDNDIFNVSTEEIFQGKSVTIPDIESDVANTNFTSESDEILIPEIVNEPKKIMDQQDIEKMSGYDLVQMSMMARGHIDSDSMVVVDDATSDTASSLLSMLSRGEPSEELSDEQQMLAIGIKQYLDHNQKLFMSESEKDTLSVYCAKRINVKKISSVVETSSVVLIAGRLVGQLFGGNQTNERMIPRLENEKNKNWNHYKQMLNQPFKKKKK